MNSAPTPREHEARRLIRTAGEAVDTDRERLWRDVQDHVARRRSPSRSRGPWLAVAAAAAIATGVVAVSWFSSQAQTRTPAAATTSTATSSSPSATPTSTPPSTRVTSEPTPSPPSALPVLTPGMTLPKNQQFADFVPISSDLRLRGRTIGLGRFHVEGKPVNLVLAPGRSLPGVFSDGTREGMCIVALPADAPINSTSPAEWREYSCHFLPGPDSLQPVGGGGLGDPSTTTIDEFADVLWPVVTTSTSATSVEVERGGVSTPLPYRITHPDLAGALFMGFLPYGPVRSPDDIALVGRDAAGKVLFRR